MRKKLDENENTIEKQAKKKGLAPEDVNGILDELDDNHEIIIKSILQDARTNSEESQGNAVKEIYIRKYSDNGKLPLCESVVVGGYPKFVQLTNGEFKLLDKFKIGRKTFYPY